MRFVRRWFKWFMICGALFFLTGGCGFYAPRIDEGATGAELVESMMSPESCDDPPCFLGHSARNITPASLLLTLTTSDLVAPETLDISPNSIVWEWSTDMVERLSDGRYSKFERFAESGMSFYDNGIMRSYSFTFHIPLQNILNQFGEDFIIIPKTSHRIFGAGYALIYPDLSGYFLAFANCQETHFNPSTTVLSFSFETYMFLEIRQANQFAIWQGYDTELPGCSALPQG